MDPASAFGAQKAGATRIPKRSVHGLFLMSQLRIPCRAAVRRSRAFLVAVRRTEDMINKRPQYCELVWGCSCCWPCVVNAV